VSSGGNALTFDVGGFNRTVVLENHVVFGSVNANRRHYNAAAQALAKADQDWLARLITRRVPLTRWHEAFEHRSGDIKVVIEFVA
jgi:threonine dehydrogenase-like Zn-dependent dehydrogenase